MYRSVQLMAALGVALSGALVGNTFAAEFRSARRMCTAWQHWRSPSRAPPSPLRFGRPRSTSLALSMHRPPPKKRPRWHRQMRPRSAPAVGCFVAPSEAGCTQHSSALSPIAYETAGDDDKPNAPQADYEMSYDSTAPIRISSTGSTPRFSAR